MSKRLNIFIASISLGTKHKNFFFFFQKCMLLFEFYQVICKIPGSTSGFETTYIYIYMCVGYY